ncbi:MAG: NAD(P)H-dependent oxidoreductase [Candidatus Rehaiarchaeum fermentans]|nr:NAD(P)H-dependent oxidoreductase [Candidatus Rehaiarchaeum fermentans]
MEKKLKILAFAGSLRKDSYNKALINTAKEISPESMEIEIFDLAKIPLFNQDEELNMPESVKEFKSKIKESDGVLIATPEYNRSFPGVLKNAIDWASRPFGDNSFEDKPVALMGATGGSIVGTSVAQMALRPVFSFLNAHLLERPVIYVAEAHRKISNGFVVDKELKESIRNLLLAFEAWIIRLKKV